MDQEFLGNFFETYDTMDIFKSLPNESIFCENYCTNYTYDEACDPPRISFNSEDAASTAEEMFCVKPDDVFSPSTMNSECRINSCFEFTAQHLLNVSADATNINTNVSSYPDQSSDALMTVFLSAGQSNKWSPSYQENYSQLLHDDDPHLPSLDLPFDNLESQIFTDNTSDSYNSFELWTDHKNSNEHFDESSISYEPKTTQSLVPASNINLLNSDITTCKGSAILPKVTVKVSTRNSSVPSCARTSLAASTSNQFKMVVPLSLANPNTPKFVDVPNFKTSSDRLMISGNRCKLITKRRSFGKRLPLNSSDDHDQLMTDSIQQASDFQLDSLGSSMGSTNAINIEPLNLPCVIQTETIANVDAVADPKKLCVTKPQRRPNRLISLKMINKTELSTNSVSKSLPISEKLPFWSLKDKGRSKGKINSLTKKKLCKAYELAPLNDPKLERCRRNAINAKKNRELKKNQMEELMEQMMVMKKEKDELEKERDAIATKYLNLQQKHEAILRDINNH